MISRLRGKIIEKQPPVVLIDVCGVGYEVLVPMTSIYTLPDIGCEVVIYTHFIVREDAQQLYGFSNKSDRRLFQELIKINGIGPKVALAIMSGMDVVTFISCVESNDSMTLTSIPGIGKKTAERLIIDIKDKITSLRDELTDLRETDIEVSDNQIQVTSLSSFSNGEIISEAINALEVLGYKHKDAKKRVMSVSSGQNTTEDLIRLALKS